MGEENPKVKTFGEINWEKEIKRLCLTPPRTKEWVKPYPRKNVPAKKGEGKFHKNPGCKGNLKKKVWSQKKWVSTRKFFGSPPGVKS